MKRGEIYWANLRPRSGSEQSGLRPVLVVSHNGFNEVEKWRSVIVLPLSTSVRQLRRGPTTVHIKKGVANLAKGSLVLAHQITTIDRTKLKKRIGALTKAHMQEVEVAIRAALALA